MAREQLQIVFKYKTLDSELAMRRVAEIFARYGITSPEFELSGRKLRTPRLISKLKAAANRIFDIAGPGYEFILASLPKFQLDFLIIRSTSEATVSWDDWVSGFVGDGDFVMAWVVDVDYDHWQNAKDPQEYEVVGKSYAQLPLRSNEMPYPLHRMEIDTSRNPGRWRFGIGYIEAVGATMWLGSSFWELTSADCTKLENVPWLKRFEQTPNVFKIQAADACFATGEGQIGERQSQLRSLLFPVQVSDRRDTSYPPSTPTRH
jgi:hypothetical protein